MVEEEDHIEEEEDHMEETEEDMVEEEEIIRYLVLEISLIRQISFRRQILSLLKSEASHIKPDMMRFQISLEILNILIKVLFSESAKMEEKMDSLQYYLKMSKKQEMPLMI